MENVSVVCFLASYLVALVLEGTRFLRRSRISRFIMVGFAGAGLLAHTVYLFYRFKATHLPPLLSSTHDWLLELAWLAVLFYLFLPLLDRELAIGVFLLPVVLLLIVSAHFVSDVPNAVVAGDAVVRERAIRAWGMLHASLLVFGMAFVILALVLGMMYVVQHSRLKHKQTLSEGLALPSLSRLARWNWWAVVVSVPLLTLGMATGVGLGLYSQRGPEPVSFSDPVILVYGAVWSVMFGFFLWLTNTGRPTAKQVAWLTIWLFGFLLVTVVGLQVLTGGLGSFDSWHACVETVPATWTV